MAEPDRPAGEGSAGNESLSRPRGGFTTKLHLSADGFGRPLSPIVTPGQWANGTHFKLVLEKIRVSRVGQGRPRKNPDLTDQEG